MEPVREGIEAILVAELGEEVKGKSASRQGEARGRVRRIAGPAPVKDPFIRSLRPGRLARSRGAPEMNWPK